MSADPDALHATVLRFDYLLKSQVTQVVEFYAAELRLQRLRENPRVMRLARMEVGQRLPLTHGSRNDKGYIYVQSMDVRRAREVMEDPHARWRALERGGKTFVERVA